MTNLKPEKASDKIFDNVTEIEFIPDSNLKVKIRYDKKQSEVLEIDSFGGKDLTLVSNNDIIYLNNGRCVLDPEKRLFCGEVHSKK